MLAMGTALVVSSLIGGYRVALRFGVDPGLGAVAGIAVGIAGLIAWSLP